MSGGPLLAVLGAGGAVGRVAVDRLVGPGAGPDAVATVRLGGRDTRRLDALGVPGAQVRRVDLDDDAALEAFCAGADVVLNCAGPSYRVLDRVARAAARAGAAYVDPAGDVPSRDALVRSGAARGTAVFSAGLMPGLTGLLPRLLAGGSGGTPPPRRVDLFVGGTVTLSAVSAIDTLLTRGPEHGQALAVWRDGAVAANALAPLHDVVLPGFPGRVHAWPFLTCEARSLATALGAGELRAHTVHVSAALPEVLATAWAQSPLGAAPAEPHVEAVMAAAAGDVARHGAFYTLLAQARPGGRVLLRTPDPVAISGVVAALAVTEVLGGRVPDGAHLAAEVLDPARAAAGLAHDPLVVELDVPGTPVEAP